VEGINSFFSTKLKAQPAVILFHKTIPKHYQSVIQRESELESRNQSIVAGWMTKDRNMPA